MYNGRQHHIQTESIQQQLVQNNLSIDTYGKRAFRHIQNKVPSNEKQNPWQKEKCTRSKNSSYLAKKKKNNKSMQCYIWFHICKLDFIHVTIAYAICH